MIHFLPAGRMNFNHEEFADELTHIMSLPELECFKFKIESDPGDLTSIDLGIRKNASTTNVNVPLEDDQSSLFTYVDFPDCEDSQVSTRVSHPQLHFGNPERITKKRPKKQSQNGKNRTRNGKRL
ncbi:hypothetical protein Tco_1352117 [Tanacetum coccineum]